MLVKTRAVNWSLWSWYLWSRSFLLLSFIKIVNVIVVLSSLWCRCRHDLLRFSFEEFLLLWFIFSIRFLSILVILVILGSSKWVLTHFLKVFFEEFFESLGPSTPDRDVININCLALILHMRDYSLRLPEVNWWVCWVNLILIVSVRGALRRILIESLLPRSERLICLRIHMMLL